MLVCVSLICEHVCLCECVLVRAFEDLSVRECMRALTIESCLDQTLSFLIKSDTLESTV